MDNLVLFEEDFNSRTKKLRWVGGDRLCQTRLNPRSPDGDKNIYRAIFICLSVPLFTTAKEYHFPY